MSKTAPPAEKTSPTSATTAALHKAHNISIDKIYNTYQSIAKVFEPLYKTLTSRENQSLQAYKGSGFVGVNNTLREGCLAEMRLDRLLSNLARKPNKHKKHDDSDSSDSDSSDDDASHRKMQSPVRQLERYMERYRKGIMKTIQGLDSVFLRAPRHRVDIKYPTLFRGVRSKTELAAWKIGAEIEMKDYLSASFSPSVAWNFQSCGRSPCCLIVLTMSKGMPGLLLPWSTDDIQGDSITDENEILLPRSTRWKVVKKYKTSIHPSTAIHCSFESIEKSKKKPITVYEVQALPWKPPTPFEIREGWGDFISDTVVRFDAYNVRGQEPVRAKTSRRRREEDDEDEDIKEVQEL